MEHEAIYWAITDDEAWLEEHRGYERSTALFNERLGEEETEAWRERAPDAPPPSVEDDP